MNHECKFTVPVTDIVDPDDRILGWYCAFKDCGKWKDNSPLPERKRERTPEEIEAKRKSLGLVRKNELVRTVTDLVMRLPFFK